MTGQNIEVPPQDFRCGYVTIIGRPNVGKSTLLNRLLKQKLSITSRKPQTTRWHLLGIKTDNHHQVIYVDTPGIQTKYKNALNRRMSREALDALAQVDVVVFVLEALKWTDTDQYIFDLIKDRKLPTIILINKIDKIKNKEALLPFIQELSGKLDEKENIIPVSAKTGVNLEAFEKKVELFLPVNSPLFPSDQISDRNERFFVSEFIREKLFKKLGDELPYNLAVTIDNFKEVENLVSIHAIIWVGSASQKAIVIGKDGKLLKSIGEEARKDIENFLGKKVFLKTWVKVKKQWTENENALKQLGY